MPDLLLLQRRNRSSLLRNEPVLFGLFRVVLRHRNRLRRNFRPDPVAGQNRNLHAVIPLYAIRASRSVSILRAAITSPFVPASR